MRTEMRLSLVYTWVPWTLGSVWCKEIANQRSGDSEKL